MTVEQLIDELMKCDPKSKVYLDDEIYCDDDDYEFLSIIEIMPDKSRDIVVLIANCNRLAI